MSQDAELVQRLAGIDRRRFLQVVGASMAALLAAEAGVSVATAQGRKVTTAPVNGQHVLPPLPYAYDALEPHIDALTMMVHHMGHHQAYVTNLNNALQNYPALRERDATDLISNLESIPEAIRTTVRNNAGGHVNHAIFWAIMRPNGGGEPGGALRQAINRDFGDFATFRNQLNAAAMGRFGSGWAWLIADRNGRLSITSTANQDSPYMQGLLPLMGIDVWEHAYYLKYQNRRAEYVNAWWNVVNWHAVEQRYERGRG